MAWMKVVEALRAAVGTPLTVKGWVRSRRDSKADGGLSFLTVHDGTCQDPIQVVVRRDLPNYESEIVRLSTGCAVEVDGTLVASQGSGQAVELAASAVRVVGWVDDPDTYPISPKRHSFEYLREVAHLRVRTNTFGAVARVRHTLAAGDPSLLRRAGFLLRPHADHHRLGLRRGGPDVPGEHAGPPEPAPHRDGRGGLRSGFLRQGSPADRLGPAQCRDATAAR